MPTDTYSELVTTLMPSPALFIVSERFYRFLAPFDAKMGTSECLVNTVPYSM